MSVPIDQLRLIFDHYPGGWGCLDRASRYIYVNREFARLVELPDAQAIRGLSPADLPCPAAAFSDVFRVQDMKVQRNRRPMQILDIHPDSQGRMHVYLSQKIPLFDEAREVIGIIFHIRPLPVLDVFSLCLQQAGAENNFSISRLLGNGSLEPENSGNWEEMTRREREVLFFLIRGNSARQIGGRLSLSHRTVEQYISFLKHKLGASSKFDLIKMAFDRGYANKIPESLFQQQISVELVV